MYDSIGNIQTPLEHNPSLTLGLGKFCAQRLPTLRLSISETVECTFDSTYFCVLKGFHPNWEHFPQCHVPLIALTCSVIEKRLFKEPGASKRHPGFQLHNLNENLRSRNLSFAVDR